MEAAHIVGVDDTGVNDDAIDDEVHHLGGLRVLGQLGPQGQLVVSGLDDAVAGRTHGLENSTHLVQAVARDRGGDDGDGVAVVHGTGVALDGLIKLGDGYNAVLVGHVSHGGMLQCLEAKGGHGTVAVGEHGAGGLLEITRLGSGIGGNVHTVIGAVIELENLFGHVVDALVVKGPLVVAVLVLLQDIQPGGGLVGVYRNVTVTDKAVDVSGRILDAVTVVLVEQGDQGGLGVQGPGAVVHVIVQEFLVGIGEKLLVEDCGVGAAIGREDHGTRDGKLCIVVGGSLVEALGPPGHIEVQICGLPQIGEVALDGFGHGLPAKLDHDVIIGTAAVDRGDDLIDGLLGGFTDAVDLDTQTLLHFLITLVDGIVDGVALEFLHENLVHEVVAVVTAEDGHLVVPVLQGIGERVLQLGLAVLDGSGGLDGGFGIHRVVGLRAGSSRPGKHKCSQNGSQQTCSFHEIPLII